MTLITARPAGSGDAEDGRRRVDDRVNLVGRRDEAGHCGYAGGGGQGGLQPAALPRGHRHPCPAPIGLALPRWRYRLRAREHVLDDRRSDRLGVLSVKKDTGAAGRGCNVQRTKVRPHHLRHHPQQPTTAVRTTTTPARFTRPARITLPRFAHNRFAPHHRVSRTMRHSRAVAKAAGSVDNCRPGPRSGCHQAKGPDPGRVRPLLDDRQLAYRWNTRVRRMAIISSVTCASLWKQV